MEQLAYKYPTEQPISKEIHIGVVDSGDLEISMSPAEKKEFTVKIYTGSDDFGKVWSNVLARFFDRYPVSAGIMIDDFGAIPGAVYLRLTQAMEELSDEK